MPKKDFSKINLAACLEGAGALPRPTSAFSTSLSVPAEAGGLEEPAPQVHRHPEDDWQEPAAAQPQQMGEVAPVAVLTADLRRKENRGLARGRRERVAVYLDHDLKDMLAGYADRTGISINRIVQYALIDYLQAR